MRASALDQDRWRNRYELTPSTRVLCSDPYIDPDAGGRMRFRLTYAGKLLATREDETRGKRSLHVHEIRREFHRQLAQLWARHPTLMEYRAEEERTGKHLLVRFRREGFNWLPLVNNQDHLVCALEILMLRDGPPGRVLADIDNRLKTIFDALRMADGPNELGASTNAGQQTPAADEDPFYVLLQDDRLITHVAVTSDTLLEPVPDVQEGNAVRLVIGVTITPYKVTRNNLDFA